MLTMFLGTLLRDKLCESLPHHKRICNHTNCNIGLDCLYALDMCTEKHEEELSLFIKWGDPGNEASTLAKASHLQRFLTHKTLYDIITSNKELGDPSHIH